MAEMFDAPRPHDHSTRARYRVPVGMPVRDEGRRTGALVSVLVHAAIITLLIVPFFLPTAVIERMQQGAGGAGPAGGGGGGRRGDNGDREALRFVRLSPDPVPTPKTLPPVPLQQVVPPVIPPVPKPITPAAVPPPTSQASAAPAQPIAAVSPGNTGGSGRDGTSGAGPGSGGGVGAGIGTGKGSATGPGTGGGTQENYPPQPIELFLPPLPAPKDVRGTKLMANFDIDDTGRVLGIEFTQTPNGDYNRRIYAVLKSLKFKPGTRPDGTPLRMKVQLTWDF